MTEIKYYTEEDKEILVNFFTKKGIGCRKNFNDYLDNYIKTNGVRVADHLLKKESINWQTKEPMMNIANWIYDSKHMRWGNEREDNVVTMMLSEPKYWASGNSLTQLVKLNPDWNHQNKEGNTALHLFAYERMYSNIQSLLEVEPYIDTNLKNNKGETFGEVLLNEALFNLKESYSDKELVRFITFVQKLPEILTKYDNSLYHMEKEELQNKINAIEPTIDLLIEFSNKIKKFDNDGARNFIKEQYKKLNNYLVEVYNYNILNNVVPNKNETVVKKQKI